MRGARWWYAAAAVCAVLGLGAAIVLARSVVHTAGDARVTPLHSSAAVTLGTRRLAVYVDRVTPAPASIRCRAWSRSGTVVRFGSPRTQLRLNQWRRVALSPPHASPGAYRLVCSNGGVRLDPSSLAVGSSPQVARILLRTVIAVGLGVAGVVAAIVLASLTAVRQRTGRRTGGPER